MFKVNATEQAWGSVVVNREIWNRLLKNFEIQLLKNRLIQGQQRFTWTSGRKCNFDGCDREDLKPSLINGWFWPPTGVKILPNEEGTRPTGPWSATGGDGKPQPDNRELRVTVNIFLNILGIDIYYFNGPNLHSPKCAILYRDVMMKHVWQCWTISMEMELCGTILLATTKSHSFAKTMIALSNSLSNRILDLNCNGSVVLIPLSYTHNIVDFETSAR